MNSAIDPGSARHHARRAPQRFAAAALLLATAAIHITIIGQHLSEAPCIGALFLALVIVSTALAALLVSRDSTPAWLATASVTGAAIVAYVLSRSVGLPQIGDDIGNWLDPLGIAALSAETLTAALALYTLGTRMTPVNRGLVAQRSR